MRYALLPIICVVTLLCQSLLVSSQARATATPVAAVLFTPTPEGQEPLPPTSTATPSPTPPPAVRLRALSTAGNINVRAQPSLESEILGTIADAREYQALRSYYRWFEFRYEGSPNGRGWVYGDLVEILGDRSLIEVIDDAANIALPDQSEVLPAGGADTETERTIAISTIQANSAQAVELAVITALPTFTRPAPTPVSLTDQLQVNAGVQNPLVDIPPILPIAILGGLGILGLLIGAIRR